MRKILQVIVPGKPQSRGSKRAIPIGDGRGGYRSNGRGGIMTRAVDSNKNSKLWMKQAGMIARSQFSGEPYEGPIVFQAKFAFQRPKSHFGTGKNAGEIKASSPEEHTQKPDLTKLMRAAEDALTGVVYQDDSQIVRYEGCCKVWVECEPYTEIVVYAL